jgi:hypothetical protein
LNFTQLKAGVLERATPVVARYDMLLGFAVAALVAHSTIVAWISAGLSLGIGLSVRSAYR